jgi:hypothetical protein
MKIPVTVGVKTRPNPVPCNFRIEPELLPVSAPYFLYNADLYIVYMPVFLTGNEDSWCKGVGKA